MNIFKLLQSLPALIGLGNDLKETFGDPSEANIQRDIQEIVPLVEKWFPTVKPELVESVARIAMSVVTLKGDRSAHHIEAVAAIIVHELPNLGVPVTQEHADAWIKATVDLLQDLGA